MDQNTAADDEPMDMPINLHVNMDNLFFLHDKLLDISESVNDTFSIQIVAFITASFVIILFGFFFETKVSKTIKCL